MELGWDVQPVCHGGIAGAELSPGQPHMRPFPDGSGLSELCLFHAAGLSEVSGPTKGHHDPTASSSAASCKGVKAGDSNSHGGTALAQVLACPCIFCRAPLTFPWLQLRQHSG